jgi:2-succinyl-5-enolpyruvyl-6-hydroxy-3-cyclohexene-1-carboxylate synthase
MATTVAATFCATLVDEWVRGGVTDAVVSPGSRSTPMALALAADDRIRVHVHHDERAAAFVALGIGVATGRPAVVLTTSGTAAVELHPAIVEAHHAKVPLLAVTGDRPPELQDVGAPQTIDQTHLYGCAVRWFAEPGVPDDATRGQWRSLAAEAVRHALGSPPGPVHLNLAFRDPLVGEPGPLPEGRAGGASWHGAVPVRPEPIDLDLGAMADAVAGRRGVIVAGGGIADPDGVLALAATMRWPVLADPRSGCRVPHESVVSHFDAVLRTRGADASLRPDIVLRLGSLPASKVLGQWLASLDAWQVGVEADGTRYDPDRDLGALLAVEPGTFARRLAAEVLGARDEAGLDDELDAAVAGAGGAAALHRSWVAADAEAASALTAVLAARRDVTEPGVARSLVAALPSGAELVVSSSMPVRDVEWYSAPRTGLRVHANRGANGIDGVVSTAVGAALGSGRPTAVLIGDVAFLHDTNALLGIARRGIDLAVVVVDNDGGGIFSFLPQATSLEGDRFEQLFGTPHGVDPGAVAAAHGLDVTRLDAADEVGPAVAGALATGGVHVLVARTERTANVAVHDELHAAVAAALAPTSPERT